MAIDLDSFPELGHFAIGVDQIRGPLDPHRLFAIHVLFPPGAVFFRHLVIGVSQEGEVETELVPKFDVAFHGVGTDTEDFRSQALYLILSISKSTSFTRAAWRIVSRIKIENDRAPLQVRQFDFGAIVRLQRKSRGFRAFFNPFRHL